MTLNDKEGGNTFCLTHSNSSLHTMTCKVHWSCWSCDFNTNQWIGFCTLKGSSLLKTLRVFSIQSLCSILRDRRYKDVKCRENREVEWKHYRWPCKERGSAQGKDKVKRSEPLIQGRKYYQFSVSECFYMLYPLHMIRWKII